MTADGSLVPPERLGSLLTAERTRQGLTIEELRVSSGVEFSADELRNIEQGQVGLADSQIQRLMAAYQATNGSLVPERSALIVDPGHRALVAGRRTKVLPENATVDDVLGRYLSLLYLMRGLSPGSSLALRDDDVDVLSRALQANIIEIEQRLFDLMLPGQVSPWFDRLRHRLAVPAAGIAVGLTGVGALVLVQFPDGERPDLVTDAPSTDLRIGTAESANSAVELAPARSLARDPGAVSAPQSAVVGAAALGLIPFDFATALPGWTVSFEGPRDGYRGNTNTVTRIISIYVSDDESAAEVADVVAHELGHAVDVMYLDDRQRTHWMTMRGLDAPWWPESGSADFHVGAGDFAEAVASELIGSPSDSDRGEFDAQQLDFVSGVLASAGV